MTLTSISFVSRIFLGGALAIGVSALCLPQDSPPTSSSPTQAVVPSVSGTPESAAQPQIVRELPAAHPISTVDPKYPKEARKQKREGTVVLHVKIGEDGKVQGLSVVSGDPDFAAAATQAVKKWRFQPNVVDGKPTAAEQSVIVNFKLPNDSYGESPSEAMSNEDFDKEVDARIAAGSLFRVMKGKGITPPQGLYFRDPEYSKEAKDARIQGTAVLLAIIEANGLPGDVRISRSIGHGLDEKAIEAVRQWKFKPATKDGEPVAALITVQIQFRIY